MDWGLALAMLWLLTAPVAALVGALVAKGGWRRKVQWAVFGLVFAPSILWLLARRGDTKPVSAPPERAPPMPAPAPDEELWAVPEPVKACPRCGFLGIRPPGVQDGVFPGGGELIMFVCPRCEHRGLPLSFDKREDYAAFLRELPRTGSGGDARS